MDEVGGYRLVRRLGEGARAEVWLGVASDAVQASRAEGQAFQRRVAVKVLRRGVSDRSVADELASLSSLDSPHILAIRDVATDSSGRICLITDQLDPGGIPRLLAARGMLTAGEAVTVMAPLLGVLATLEDAAVVHGAISLGHVLFDDRGAPVLTGFGSSYALGDERRSTGVEGELLHDDRVAMFGVLATVLGASTGGRRALRAELDSWFSATAGGSTEGTGAKTAAADLTELQSMVFAFASPEPLCWDRNIGSTPSSVRLARASATAEMPPPTSGLASLLEAAAVPAWLNAIVSDPLAKVFAAISSSGLWQRLREVRPRFWGLGAGGFVGVVVMLVLLFAGTEGEGSGAEAASVSVEAEPNTTLGGVAGSEDGREHVDERPESVTDATAESDDPVVATRQLLAERARCLAAHDAECVASVDQRDSAALEADLHAIATATTGDPIAEDWSFAGEAEVLLLQQLGGTAIVSVTQADAAQTRPASVLIIRTEAGWRIRDVIVD